jgi:hypothetical protein
MSNIKDTYLPFLLFAIIKLLYCHLDNNKLLDLLKVKKFTNINFLDIFL